MRRAKAGAYSAATANARSRSTLYAAKQSLLRPKSDGDATRVVYCEAHLPAMDFREDSDEEINAKSRQDRHDELLEALSGGTMAAATPKKSRPGEGEAKAEAMDVVEVLGEPPLAPLHQTLADKKKASSH